MNSLSNKNTLLKLKKHCRFLLFFLCIAALSCAVAPLAAVADDDDDAEFKESRRKMQQELSVDFEIPWTGNNAIDTIIRARYMELLDKFMGIAKEEMLGDPLYSSPAYSLNIENKIFHPSSNALTLVMEYSTYTGGAHGMYFDIAYSFALPSGKELTLQDVFADSRKALQIFSDYSRKALTHGEATNMEWIHSGTEPTEENFACWMLTPQGIRISFPPYQVDCYAAGKQTVDIPLRILETAQPNKALWGQK